MSGGEFWGHYGSKEEVINRLTGQRRLDKKPLNWVLKDEQKVYQTKGRSFQIEYTIGA